MEELMHGSTAVLPVLTYLFRRLEERFDGAPTLLMLDEAWVFLDDPLFAGRIREWLKTLRKKNVSVVFATQSLADIQRSPIAPAIIESCPSRIFLPHRRRRSRSCAASMRASVSTTGRSTSSRAHPEARLLLPVAARRPAVRSGSWADRARLCRGLADRKISARWIDC